MDELDGEQVIFSVKRNKAYAILRSLLFSLIVPAAMIGGAGIGVACGASLQTLYAMIIFAVLAEGCIILGIAYSVSLTSYILTDARAVCDKGRKGHYDIKLSKVTEVTYKPSRVFKGCGHIYFKAQYNICNFYCVDGVEELYTEAVSAWKSCIKSGESNP